MRTFSVRARATALAVLLSAVVLAVAGALVVQTLDRQLTSNSDDVSRLRARDLLDQAAVGDLSPVLRNVNDDGVAQVVAADGAVLAASPNIEGRPAIVDPEVATGGGERRTIRAPDDQETETYRVWLQDGDTPDGRVTVVVGSSLEAVQEATGALRRTLLVGGPLVLAALGFVIWLVLGAALARLDRIRAEVDAIGHDQLDRRIADDGRRDEVGRLAATMNRMLGRIDGAVQRQRRLVADVSHDLQGPLATQRVSMELALASPGTVDPRVLRDEVLDATGQMEHLVDDLLVLATADEGVPVQASAVDLDAVVLEEATRARNATDRDVDTARVSAGPVRANPGELRRVVRNLLDNACTHARSRVEVRVAVVGDEVVLDVLDDGPGVPAADRELVFERFQRGDPSRSRRAPGTGLGLAIARSLAERADGTLELADDGPGAHFRLTLPLLVSG
jgi:signal transduction histidine kinase